MVQDVIHRRQNCTKNCQKCFQNCEYADMKAKNDVKLHSLTTIDDARSLRWWSVSGGLSQVSAVCYTAALKAGRTSLWKDV